MARIAVPTVLLVSVALALGLNGCNSQAPDTGSTTPAVQTNDSHDPHVGHSDDEHAQPADNGQTAMEKMKAELAKLPPEDAASALQQHFCPVSGEMLGTMGPPKKVDVNGQQVWICCDDCKDKLLASPEEYLKKLKKE